VAPTRLDLRPRPWNRGGDHRGDVLVTIASQFGSTAAPTIG